MLRDRICLWSTVLYLLLALVSVASASPARAQVRFWSGDVPPNSIGLHALDVPRLRVVDDDEGDDGYGGWDDGPGFDSGFDWGAGWGDDGWGDDGGIYYWNAPPARVYHRPPPVIYIEPHRRQDKPYYWYHCSSPKGYYPYVKQCPPGWVKVVPHPPHTVRPHRSTRHH